MILFQGLEDAIVPPAQSEVIVEALKREGAAARLPRRSRASSTGSARPATSARSLEAELYFYGRVFGFTPAGEIEPVAIENLTERASASGCD